MYTLARPEFEAEQWRRHETSNDTNNTDQVLLLLTDELFMRQRPFEMQYTSNLCQALSLGVWAAAPKWLDVFLEGGHSRTVLGIKEAAMGDTGCCQCEGSRYHVKRTHSYHKRNYGYVKIWM